MKNEDSGQMFLITAIIVSLCIFSIIALVSSTEYLNDMTNNVESYNFNKIQSNIIETTKSATTDGYSNNNINESFDKTTFNNYMTIFKNKLKNTYLHDNIAISMNMNDIKEPHFSDSGLQNGSPNWTIVNHVKYNDKFNIKIPSSKNLSDQNNPLILQAGSWQAKFYRDSTDDTIIIENNESSTIDTDKKSLYVDITNDSRFNFNDNDMDNYSISFKNGNMSHGRYSISGLSMNNESFDKSRHKTLVMDINSSSGNSEMSTTVPFDIPGIQQDVKDDNNISPVADFTFNPENPFVSDTINFNASESYDIDGTITDYNWNMGDGTTKSGEHVQHIYSSIGSYNVTLTVIDDDDIKHTINKKVNVSQDIETIPNAFEDKNHNGIFDGNDYVIPASEISDGVYNASKNNSSLVIPPSLNNINAKSINLTGENVTVYSDLTASNNDVTISSKDDINLYENNINTESTSQPINVSSDTSINLINTSLTSYGHTTLESGSHIYTKNITINTQNGWDEPINIQSGDNTNILDSKLIADSIISIQSQSSVVATNTNINNSDAWDMDVIISSKNNTNISQSTITSQGYVDVVSDSKLVANNTMVDTSMAYGRNINLDSENSANITNAVFNAQSDININSNGKINASNTIMDTLNAWRMGIDILAHDNINLNSSELRGDYMSGWFGDLEAEVVTENPENHSVYVNDAQFYDGNDKLDITPDNLNVIGEPQHGGVE